MTTTNDQYVVFHIPTAQYLVCHTNNTTWMLLPKKGEQLLSRKVTEVFLLPPGADLSYDSPAILFRASDPDKLLKKVAEEIDSNSYHYQGRALEEFEIHLFELSMVPAQHYWKEYDKLGILKTEVDVSLCS